MSVRLPIVSVRLPIATEGGPAGWLELTPDYRCNHRCLGCGAIDGGPALDARAMVRAMAEARREGVAQLWIGGGEPTLRPDLLPLVREAKRRGFSRIRLQTNGAMLAYEDFVARLADAGLTEVSFSVKGPDAATHDHFSRAEGAFELLLRGIDHVRTQGLAAEADLLVYRSTSARIPAMVRELHARGVGRFRVWMMAPDASDPEALAEEPRWSEVAAGVEAALALGLSEDPEHVVSLHSPPCTLDDPRARFYAPALGLVVHDASGHRFRLEDSEIEGGTFTPRCEGCGLRDRCNGVRAAYVGRHGDGELRPNRDTE